MIPAHTVDYQYFLQKDFWWALEGLFIIALVFAVLDVQHSLRLLIAMKLKMAAFAVRHVQMKKWTNQTLPVKGQG